jgi:putative membrane protein
MGLLGALITLAPRLVYQSHALTAPSWGLTALEDQQLGGLIMWVPACAVLLIAGLGVLYGVLTRSAAAEDWNVRPSAHP